MDFELTQEQRMLKESARKLMEREIEPYLARFEMNHQMTQMKLRYCLGNLFPWVIWAARSR